MKILKTKTAHPVTEPGKTAQAKEPRTNQICHAQPAPGRPPGKLAFKIAEVAAILGISESSVRRAIKSGDLRAVRKLRHILIPATEIERFLSVGD